MSEEEKLLIVSTHGPENPEKCLMPFIVANAAMALDVEVTVFLMNAGVDLSVPGAADRVPALEGMPKLPDLMKSFEELGGKILLCGPCCNHRGINSDNILPNAKVGGAAGLVDMIMNQKVLSF